MIAINTRISLELRILSTVNTWNAVSMKSICSMGIWYYQFWSWRWDLTTTVQQWAVNLPNTSLVNGNRIPRSPTVQVWIPRISVNWPHFPKTGYATAFMALWALIYTEWCQSVELLSDCVDLSVEPSSGWLRIMSEYETLLPDTEFLRNTPRRHHSKWYNWFQLGVQEVKYNECICDAL